MLKGNERETSVKCQMAFKNQSIPQNGPSDRGIRREREEVIRSGEADSVETVLRRRGRMYKYENIRTCFYWLYCCVCH